MLANGALTTEDPTERCAKGLRTNPDGDVEVHGVDYSTFRYPACPTCLSDFRSGKLKLLANGDKPHIELDADGAWMPTSNAGILKPAVVMFGENVADATKQAVESAVDAVDRILVVGSSLATYSAWRIVKRASDLAMRIGMLNVGGVRGEEVFLKGTPMENTGSLAVRVNQKADLILPEVVKMLEESGRSRST
jgi:NAD-dependent SIR2 family protein deacetylase